MDLAVATVASPVGELTVAATAVGLLTVTWERDGPDAVAARLGMPLVSEPARLDAVRRQLDEYFAGTRRAFDLAVDWRLARGFRLAVLRALASAVPCGAVVTYGELAALAGNPRAARAVGSAMAGNLLPIVVPCHRVVPRAGGPGRYSGAGGADTKRWLLEWERVSPGAGR